MEKRNLLAILIFSIFILSISIVVSSQINMCNGADIDNNGKVDVYDIAFFQRVYGTYCNNSICSSADLDNDGDVDIFDWAIFQPNWGRIDCLKEIMCYNNLNCGNATITKDCLGNISRTFTTTPICYNPGTIDSYCNPIMMNYTKNCQNNSLICLNGGCINPER